MTAVLRGQFCGTEVVASTVKGKPCKRVEVELVCEANVAGVDIEENAL